MCTGATTRPGQRRVRSPLPNLARYGNGAMGNARKTLRSGTKPATANGGPPRAPCARDTRVRSGPGRGRRRAPARRVRQSARRSRFGFATVELVGQPLSRLVPEVSAADRWQALAEILERERQTAASIQASARCKDGYPAGAVDRRRLARGRRCGVRAVPLTRRRAGASPEHGRRTVEASLKKRSESRSSAAGPGTSSATSIGGPTSCTECCRSIERGDVRSCATAT